MNDENQHKSSANQCKLEGTSVQIQKYCEKHEKTQEIESRGKGLPDHDGGGHQRGEQICNRTASEPISFDANFDEVLTTFCKKQAKIASKIGAKIKRHLTWRITRTS